MSIRNKLYVCFLLVAVFVVINSLVSWMAVDQALATGLQAGVEGAADHSFHQTLIILFTFASLLACIIGAVVLMRAINRPMARILSNLEKTEQGELTDSIKVVGSDELASASKTH